MNKPIDIIKDVIVAETFSTTIADVIAIHIVKALNNNGYVIITLEELRTNEIQRMEERG